MKERIVIFTNMIPHYRKDFYSRIFSEYKRITVFCNKNIENSGLNSIHMDFDENVQVVSYKQFFGKVLLKKIPLFKIINNYEIFIFDGNPRHITQVVISSLLGILRRKVIIWSVGHSRNNNKFTIKIRVLWWRVFFSNFLMYNESDVKYLINQGFYNKNILSINNGLNQSKIEEVKTRWDIEMLKKWEKDNKIDGKRILLSSGRLFYEKYSLLIDAISLGTPFISPNIGHFTEINSKYKCGFLYSDKEELADIIRNIFQKKAEILDKFRNNIKSYQKEFGLDYTVKEFNELLKNLS